MRGRWERFRPAVILPIVDVLAVAAAAFLVSGTAPGIDILTAVLLLASMSLWKLYRVRLTVSVLNDLPTILASCLTAGALAAAAGSVLTGVTSAELRFGLTMTLLVVVGRISTYWFIRHRRRAGHNQVPTVIVGTGPLAQLLGEAVTTHKELGCDLLGFVDAESAEGLHNPLLPGPVLGGLVGLSPQVAGYGASRVLVAFPAMKGEDLVAAMRELDRAGTEVYVVPRLFEMTAITRHVEEIEGIPLQHLHRTPYRSPAWLLKRPLDMLVSGAALLLLAPVMAVIALVNRFVDGPDILFRQPRVGLDGREFDVLKFRSMKPANEHESATNWNIKNDDRLTPWGKFLRRSSLDELPQLWNILRGDMSLVGPRPERPHFVRMFGAEIGRYDARHRVPSGLTGWAQVNGLRGDTSIEDRVRYDNYYIQNWSLWLDMKIMLRTLTSFLRGSG